MNLTMVMALSQTKWEKKRFILANTKFWNKCFVDEVDVEVYCSCHLQYLFIVLNIDRC